MTDICEVFDLHIDDCGQYTYLNIKVMTLCIVKPFVTLMAITLLLKCKITRLVSLLETSKQISSLSHSPDEVSVKPLKQKELSLPGPPW